MKLRTPVGVRTPVLYRKGTPHRLGLTRIAYELLDRGETTIGRQLLNLSREITGMTLSHNVPPASILRAVDVLMHDLGVTYCLIGGMAVNVYARPRGTDDIDILVNNFPPVARTKDRAYMGSHGFYRAESRTGGHLILDSTHGGVVECLPANNLLRLAALACAGKTTVMGVHTHVVSPAFLIGLKAAAIRSNPKRTGLDAQDIVAVYTAHRPDLGEVRAVLSREENAVLRSILGAYGADL